MDTKQFIGQLSDEELRLYIIAFVDQNKEAGSKLCDFITRQISAVGINNAEVSVEQSFNVTRNFGDHWHSQRIRDWDSIYSESFRLFERAHNALSTGHLDIALAIATRWLECFADTYDDDEAYYFDEENFHLGNACENAMKVINEALTHANVSDDAKTNTAQRLNDLADRHDLPFCEYFCIDFRDFVANVNALTMDDEDALA